MLSRYSTDFSFRNIILILFYLNGVTAAVYPLLGSRFLFLSYGSGMHVLVASYAAYLVGMLIGIYTGGRYIDAKWYELKHFMYAELITGFYALIFISTVHLLPNLYRHFLGQIMSGYASANMINFTLTFVIIFPLAILNGAKFSIIGRYLIRQDDVVAREMGMMHSSHLMGISLGCMVSTVFVQFVGVRLTFVIIPFINFINAVTIKILLVKFAHPQRLVSEFYDQQLKYFSKLNDSITPFLKYFVLVLNGVIAFIAVAYIILFFRPLLYLADGNLYIQGSILAFVTLFLALGSLLAAKGITEDRNMVFKAFITFIGLAVMLLLTVIYQPKILIFSKKLWLNQYSYLSFLSFADIIIFVALTMLCIGVLQPVLFKIYLTKFERIGNNVGRYYVSFFIGILAAVVLVPNVFVRWPGAVQTAAALGSISFLVTVILFLRKPEILLLIRLLYAVIVGIILVCFHLFVPDFSKVTDSKTERVLAVLGTNSIYSVHENRENHDRTLKVNGITTTGDSRHYYFSKGLLVHLPMLFHPEAKDVFVAGFGTGLVPQKIATYPVNSISCCEISDEVIRLSKYFDKLNHDVLTDNRFQPVQYDPFSYLNLSERQYDVIIVNYLHPAFYRNFIHYTREFFDLCYQRLRDNGVIAVEVPMISFSREKMSVIVNTLNASFENVTLWFSNNNLNFSLVLLGIKNKELEIDFTGIGKRMSLPAVAADLDSIGLANVYEYLDCFILSASSLAKISEQMQHVNSYFQPYFKLTAVHDEDHEFNYVEYLKFLNRNKEPVFDHLVNIEDSGQEERTVKSILEKYYSGSNYVFEGLIGEYQEDLLQALQVYRMGFKANPLEYGVNRFLNSYYNPQLNPYPKTPAELVENAQIYFQKMNYQKAIELFKQALKLDRNYAPAYFGLGINYEALNDIRNAKRMYQRTLRLRPKLEQARERLNNIVRHEQEMADKIKRGLFIK